MAMVAMVAEERLIDEGHHTGINYYRVGGY